MVICCFIDNLIVIAEGMQGLEFEYSLNGMIATHVFETINVVKFYIKIDS